MWLWQCQRTQLCGTCIEGEHLLQQRQLRWGARTRITRQRFCGTYNNWERTIFFNVPQQRSASSIKCQGADVETAGAVKVLCLYFLQPQQEVDGETSDAALWIALG